MIDTRIAERRAAVRDEGRRRRLRRTIGLVVVVALVTAVVLVERSDLVGLEEIEVVGTNRLDAETIREAADLALGTSTLRLRLGRVEERVETLPLVASARAQRVDPLTVRIEVVEREPALVAVGDQGPVLLDRDGLVLVVGDLDGLPRIDVRGAAPQPGDSAAVDPGLANAVRAWRGLSGPLRARVTRFEAHGPDELTLHLDSGVEVRFGRAERVDEKVRALGAVLGDIGDTVVAIIDVRAPSAPVVIGGPG